MNSSSIKKEDLLKIKHADDIKDKLNQISSVDKAVRDKVMNEEGDDGKTYKEKIEEAKDKKDFGALNILIIPAIVQFIINQSKDKDLKKLKEEVKQKTDKLVEDITQTMYGDSETQDKIREDEQKQKYKERVDKIIDTFMEKKYAEIQQKINNGGADISEVEDVVRNTIEEMNLSRDDKKGRDNFAQNILNNKIQNEQFEVNLGEDEALIEAVKAAKKGDKTIDLSKGENQQLNLKVADVPDGQQFKFTTNINSTTVTAVKKGDQLQLC